MSSLPHNMEGQRGMLTSIQESSERSMRDSERSLNNNNRSSSSGYDYLQSVISADSIEAPNDDAETWNDSSLLKNPNGYESSGGDPNDESFNASSLLQYAGDFGSGGRDSSGRDSIEQSFSNNSSGHSINHDSSLLNNNHDSSLLKNPEAFESSGRISNDQSFNTNSSGHSANHDVLGNSLNSQISGHSGGSRTSVLGNSLNSQISGHSGGSRPSMVETSFVHTNDNGRISSNRYSTLSLSAAFAPRQVPLKDIPSVGSRNNRHSTLTSLRENNSSRLYDSTGAFSLDNLPSTRENNSSRLYDSTGAFSLDNVPSSYTTSATLDSIRSARPGLGTPNTSNTSNATSLSSIRSRRLGHDNSNSNSPRSALRKGPAGRPMSVNFAGQVGDSRQSLYGPDDEILASEQFFVDPNRPQRHVNFQSGIRQGKESMATELKDIEQYLATLKKSVVETRKSIESDTSMISSGSNERSARPGMDANNPKSRRRFSMAYRTNDEVVTFPDDCFSFLIVHGPIESPYFFFFALTISILQLGFLALALFSMVGGWKTTDTTDNPTSFGNSFFNFFPSNVPGLVRTTQFFAMISYLLLSDMSVKDYLTALDLFPQYSMLAKGDKYGCMVFSCVLRFLMGFLTVVVTLIMLLTSDDVIDTILDFLAMNFISDIGKMAFQLCLWGKYGRRLEEEARRLENMQLPKCMLRKQTKTRYKLMIYPIIIMVMTFLLGLWGVQNNDRYWATQIVRIQFAENSDLEPYSGCYETDQSQNKWYWNNRLIYDSSEKNRESATIGFCRGINTWKLVSGEESDPCSVGNENILLTSPSTSTYDIKASTSSPWNDKHGKPVAMYFFSDSESEIRASCGSFLNDGNCDSTFNEFETDYDGGDCCAPTCTRSNCGVGALKSAFGTNVYGDGFPDCIDPSMVPITIKIESVFDSFTYENGDSNEASEGSLVPRLRLAGTDVIEPIMMLDCDDKNILTVEVNEKMAGQTETVMIEDRANCTIRINNSTTASLLRASPIWYVNYTVYHGDESAVENDPIVIRQEQSVNNEFLNFPRIPDCYFRKLSGYLDNSTIYTGKSPEIEAIHWLRDASRFSRNSGCEDDYFLERYALSVLNFAARIKPTEEDSISGVLADVDSITSDVGESISTTPGLQEVKRDLFKDKFLWIEDTRQCIWRAVSCSQRSVATLDLHMLNLDGTIASSIGMLTNLTKFDIAINNFRGPIPSEIGNLGALEIVNMGHNYLTGTIPTEIGLLTSVRRLNLTNNSLSSSIPTEIGALSDLEVLDLSDNLLEGTIPTELGALKNLTKVLVSDNLALVMMGDPIYGLRDVVYTECVIEGCQSGSADNESCQKLQTEYEENEMQLPIDNCTRLKTDCLICK